MSQYLYNFANRIINSVSVIVFALILGNLLVQEEVGIYAVFVMSSAYGVAILGIQVNVALMQKLNDIQNEKVKEQYYTAGLVTTLFFGILIIAIFNIFSTPMSGLFKLEDIQIIFYSSILAFLIILRSYITHILQSLLENKYIFYSAVLAFIVTIISFFITYFSGYKLEGAIYAIYAGHTVFILTGFIKISKIYKIKLDNKFYHYIKSILSFSTVVYFVSLAAFLDNNIDLLLVNYFLTKEDVAVYNYAIKIAALFLLVGASISNVSFPKVAALYSKNEMEKISVLMEKILKTNFFIVMILSILFLSVSKDIVDFILPPEYNKINDLLYLLVPGIVLFAGFFSIKFLFNAIKMPSLGLIVDWGAFFINLILSLLLIPIFGLIGAAASTITSFIFRPMMLIYLINKKTKISYNIKYLYLILPLYFLFTFFIFLFDNNVTIKVLIAITFICILTFIIKPYNYLNYKFKGNHD
ncbi:lipopolysaccharide biosynthesis protein [Sulfurimonas sp.]|uniref:lipopolysaccharide biosynthesis protein n=1 Tax=Sulfurimonas sp. TaxID=2022749 RepID=UPI0035685C97